MNRPMIRIVWTIVSVPFWLFTIHGLRFTAPPALADDLAPAAGAGIELSVFDRVSNGQSKSNFIFSDYLAVGVALGGSLELAESVRGFAGITPVLRLKETDKGFFEGFRWDLGVTYEIDESLYASGALRLHSRREKQSGRTYIANSFGLVPRFGYRTEIDPDLFWFVEGGMPLLFVNEVKHLPEILFTSGIEKRF